MLCRELKVIASKLANLKKLKIMLLQKKAREAYEKEELIMKRQIGLDLMKDQRRSSIEQHRRISSASPSCTSRSPQPSCASLSLVGLASDLTSPQASSPAQAATPTNAGSPSSLEYAAASGKEQDLRRKTLNTTKQHVAFLTSPSIAGALKAEPGESTPGAAFGGHRLSSSGNKKGISSWMTSLFGSDTSSIKRSMSRDLSKST